MKTKALALFLALLTLLTLVTQGLPGATVSAYADGLDIPGAEASGAALLAVGPTAAPTAGLMATLGLEPTAELTATQEPTVVPTAEPTAVPTPEPTVVPTAEPTAVPVPEPTPELTATPEPTATPTPFPTAVPGPMPTVTAAPVAQPTPTPKPLEPAIDTQRNAFFSPAFTWGWVEIAQNAPLLTTPGDAPFATLSRGIGYALSRPNPGGWHDCLAVAFGAGGMAQTAYIPAEYLRPMSQEEIAAYLFDCAQATDVPRYQNDPLLPLLPVGYTSAAKAEPTGAPEPTAAGVVLGVELEPTLEPTGTPEPAGTPEPTGIPELIATPEPTAAGIVLGVELVSTLEPTAAAVLLEVELVPTPEPTVSPEPKGEPVAGAVVLGVELLPALEPTATSEPTATPEPTPTPEPVEESMDSHAGAEMPASLLEAGLYNPGDIQVLNDIIANHGLIWTPTSPADGSYVPADWAGVTWSEDALNKRVIGLDLRNTGLTGSLNVSALAALGWLDCAENRLSGLNASGLAALKQLDCGGNGLTALDVSRCAALVSLQCQGNGLTALDVSACAALNRLLCSENKLAALDVSGCSALGGLWCEGNQLTDLNVAGCPALLSLHCQNNSLRFLDVSKCGELTYLYCQNNRLTGMSVSGSPWTELDCSDNEMADEGAVAGFLGSWDGMKCVFAPQQASGGKGMASTLGAPAHATGEEASFIPWESQTYGKIVSDRANAYDQPDGESAVASTLARGDAVLWLSANGSWACVMLDENTGAQGYIELENIEKIDALQKDDPFAPLPEDTRAIVTEEQAGAYRFPDEDLTAFSQATYGDVVEVLLANSSWALVRVQGTEEGYTQRANIAYLQKEQDQGPASSGEPADKLTLDDFGMQPAALSMQPMALSMQRTFASAMSPLNPQTLVVSVDNENNAHSGKPDGDLNVYLGVEDSIVPTEVRFDLTELPSQYAHLAIHAWDCDEQNGSVPEYDEVYVNGEKVGVMTGENNQWNTTLIKVPVEYLRLGANYVTVTLGARNLLTGQIYYLLPEAYWMLEVKWVQLLLDGGSVTSKPDQFNVEITNARHQSGMVHCDAEVTIDSKQSRAYEVEYSLVDNTTPASRTYLQIISTDATTVTGTAVTTKGTLRLPLNAGSGEYLVQVLLKDRNTSEILAVDEIAFDFTTGIVPSFDITNLKATLSTEVETVGPVTMYLSAKVNDPDGKIKDVSFYVDGKKVATKLDSAGIATGEYRVAENGQYLVEVRYTKDGQSYNAKLYKDVFNIKAGAGPSAPSVVQPVVVYPPPSPTVSNEAPVSLSAPASTSASGNPITATPTSITFTATDIGYGIQAAQSIIVKNNSNKKITGLKAPLDANTKFEIVTTPFPKSIARNGQVEVLVRPRQGLGMGTHTGMLTITSDNGSASVALSFTVKEYKATITANTGYYGIGNGQMFTITNVGTGTITDLEATLGAGTKFEITQRLSSATLDPKEKTSLVIRPNGRQPVLGTHQEELTIKGSKGINITVSLSLSSGSLYAATISSPVNINPFIFPEAPIGYKAPEEQTFIISNIGTQTIGGLKATLSANSDFFISTGPSSKSLAPNSSVALKVRPNTGRKTGRYQDTLTITGNNGVRLSATLEFIVNTPGIDKLSKEAMPFKNGDGGLLIYLSPEKGYQIPEGTSTTVYWDQPYTGEKADEVSRYKVVVSKHFGGEEVSLPNGGFVYQAPYSFDIPGLALGVYDVVVYPWTESGEKIAKAGIVLEGVDVPVCSNILTLYVGTEQFLWPIKEVWNLSSGYTKVTDDPEKGKVRPLRLPHGPHAAIDIPTGAGTKVYASLEGKVVEIRSSAGYYVVLEHKIRGVEDKIYTHYAHLSDPKDYVKVGAEVSQGAVIGKVGSQALTGLGEHLHFAVSYDPGVSEKGEDFKRKINSSPLNDRIGTNNQKWKRQTFNGTVYDDGWLMHRSNIQMSGITDAGIMYKFEGYK